MGGSRCETYAAPDHGQREHGVALLSGHQHAEVGVVDDEGGEVEVAAGRHALRRGHVVETAPEQPGLRSARDRVVEVSAGAGQTNHQRQESLNGTVG